MGIARGAAMVLAGALAVGAATGVPATAAAAVPAPAPAVRWSPALNGGEAVGVEVTGDGARLAASRVTADAALSLGGPGDTASPGMLTLASRGMAVPVDRVEATLSLDDTDQDTADAEAADAVGVDIRGYGAGHWTEWVPAEPPAPTTATPTDGPRPAGTLQVALPEAVTQVQARLVLTPAAPVEVRGLTLAAYAAGPSAQAEARRPAERYNVYATREGLVGGTTANGHVIVKRDLFVALPSRRSLSPRNASDYSVKVCAASGRCAFAPVWDVGPWNTRDDYWNPSNQRQNWSDLPRGVPEAQAAKAQGYHGGKDQFGRVVRNPAAIDLADGLFWDALGLRDNAWVTVDYLWTGDSKLSRVTAAGRVNLRGAPSPTAPIVGLVAGGAAVPLQCVTGKWLQIGTGLFLPSASVPRAQWPGQLPRCTGH